VSETAPIIVEAIDPEVMALQGMVVGLHHFNTRQLTMRHFKLMVATELCRRVFRVFGTKAQLANLARIPVDEMEPEFSELLELKYVHEIVPTFGDNFTYKIGAKGGTLLRHMLKDANREESSSSSRKRPGRSRQ